MQPAADESLRADTGEIIPIAKAESYIVAYPSGEILDRAGDHGRLPDGVHFVSSSEKPAAAPAPSQRELEAGRRYVEITYSRSQSRPREKGYYTTTLTNTSDSKVRVVRFAGFVEAGGTLVLNTITDDFFSEQQFREWYGVDDDGWIKPGQRVCDPNNYGGRGIWVYYFVTEQGESFAAGARVPGSV